MKRDWDVIRYVLTEVERKEELSTHLFAECKYSDEVLSYHLDLLIEAELIKGERLKIHGVDPQYDIERLSWEGHQFWDAIRDETTWNKTIKKVTDSGLGFTFEVVKSVAIGYAKDKLGV